MYLLIIFTREFFTIVTTFQMLKRLSYPLAWVEGLTGSEEQTPPTSAADPQHTSMFSKVFSR